MRPLKRPFADWVDDRVIPEFQWFRELHPWIWKFFSATAGVALLALAQGDWWIAAVLAGAWVAVGLCFWLGRAVRRYVWIRQQRLAWNRANHICVHCGYDMRVTPERCSECGRLVDGD